MADKADKKSKKKESPAGKKESKLRALLKPKQEGKQAKTKSEGKPAKDGKHRVTSNKLKLLITVVGRYKTEYYMDLIQSFDVNMQLIALAQGTANAKMLDYLGLTDNEKSVIFSVIQENKVPDAMHALEEKFATIKDGKGVAFTVPLTSVIGTLIYRFLSNNRMAAKENKQ
ncbi:MAG: hypothetical protein K2M95_01500 [Clostridiales bacterium]|nr:hypothetical protein [Clostridiales bacterium]